MKSILQFVCIIAAVLQNVEVVEAIHKEIFTTNAVCRQNFCINPVFPGLEDLYTLSQMEFECQDLLDVSPTLDFCKLFLYTIYVMKVEGNYYMLQLT